jgi:hydrogenase/urease accessory protein HupE
MDHGFNLVRIQSEAFEEAMLLRFEIADATMRTTVADLGSALRKEMIAQTRTMIVALATIMVGLVTAFIAAR